MSSSTLTEARRTSVEIASLRVVVRCEGALSEPRALDLEEMIVGSGIAAHLVVRDRRVSGRHCALRVAEGGVILRDLGSKNGTWIGDVRVSEVLLPPGASVTIGGSELTVERAGPPQTLALSREDELGDAVGGSVVMRRLFALLRQAASTELCVLFLGETGTGKSILARALHDASPRRDKPFVTYDCAASTDRNMVASALFGHLRGAFTGADSAREGRLSAAGGGTLLLEEVGDLPLDLQPMLLQALEPGKGRYCPLGANTYRPFHGRVLAATHKNLEEMVRAKTFREDLYYRLAEVKVTVPALRERRDDIPLLVEKILADMSPPRPPAVLSPEMLTLLLSHDWPGNVRELRSTVARMVELPGFPVELRRDAGRARGAPSRAGDPADAEDEPWDEALLDLDLAAAREEMWTRFLRWYAGRILKACGGKVKEAAKRMGVSAKYLYALKKEHDLSGDETDEGA